MPPTFLTYDAAGEDVFFEDGENAWVTAFQQFLGHVAAKALRRSVYMDSFEISESSTEPESTSPSYTMLTASITESDQLNISSPCTVYISLRVSLFIVFCVFIYCLFIFLVI